MNIGTFFLNVLWSKSFNADLMFRIHVYEDGSNSAPYYKDIFLIRFSYDISLVILLIKDSIDLLLNSIWSCFFFNVLCSCLKNIWSSSSVNSRPLIYIFAYAIIRSNVPMYSFSRQFLTYSMLIFLISRWQRSHMVVAFWVKAVLFWFSSASISR